MARHQCSLISCSGQAWITDDTLFLAEMESVLQNPSQHSPLGPLSFPCDHHSMWCWLDNIYDICFGGFVVLHTKPFWVCPCVSDCRMVDEGLWVSIGYIYFSQYSYSLRALVQWSSWNWNTYRHKRQNIFWSPSFGLQDCEFQVSIKLKKKK